MAGLGLSNGFATSEQESSSLLWEAGVPPGFSLLCIKYSWYHYFTPSDPENTAVDRYKEYKEQQNSACTL